MSSLHSNSCLIINWGFLSAYNLYVKLFGWYCFGLKTHNRETLQIHTDASIQATSLHAGIYNFDTNNTFNIHIWDQI